MSSETQSKWETSKIKLDPMPDEPDEYFKEHAENKHVNFEATSGVVFIRGGKVGDKDDDDVDIPRLNARSSVFYISNPPSEQVEMIQQYSRLSGNVYTPYPITVVRLTQKDVDELMVSVQRKVYLEECQRVTWELCQSVIAPIKKTTKDQSDADPITAKPPPSAIKTTITPNEVHVVV